MKIYIFGSNGMLGQYMKVYLEKEFEIIPLTRKDYDLSLLTKHSLEKFLNEKNIEKGDVVINCAGIIPQRGNNNKKIYYMVNGIFPILLSSICDDLNAKFIHITTDCVFSGKNGKYDENSIPDEDNDYGISKNLGESHDGTIIRTSIIGEEVNNKKSLLEWVKSNKNKQINGYINHYWNGMTCLELSKIVMEIICKELYWKGIRHIFSEDISKYELIKIISKVYKLNINIIEYKTDKVDKTLRSVYPSMFNMASIKQQIKDLYYFKNI